MFGNVPQYSYMAYIWQTWKTLQTSIFILEILFTKVPLTLNYNSKMWIYIVRHHLHVWSTLTAAASHLAWHIGPVIFSYHNESWKTLSIWWYHYHTYCIPCCSDEKLDESERKLLILVLQLQIQAVAVLRFAAGDNPSPSIIRPEACWAPATCNYHLHSHNEFLAQISISVHFPCLDCTSLRR